MNKKKNIIIVCLSASKSNTKVIKTAFQLAENEKAKLMGVYIFNQKYKLTNHEQQQLEKNLEFAEQSGAEIEIIYADDIANQIIRIANLYKAKKIVIGKNNKDKKIFTHFSPLYIQILNQAEDIDIHIVPVDAKTKIPKIEKNKRTTLQEFMLSAFILLVSTVIGYFFFKIGFHDSNIIMIYILGVFLIAVITSSRICSIMSSIISVILFNFCFTFPTMSLSVYDSSYAMTFFIMIIVAFFSSTLTSRIKQKATQYSDIAYISKILLETNQTLQELSLENDVINSGCTILSKLLNRDIIYYPVNNNELYDPTFIPAKKKSSIEKYLTSNEKGVAQWVAIHNKHAGATTQYLPNSKCLYYAIRNNKITYGVIGINLDNDRLTSIENRILLAILGEMTLSLNNIRSIKEKNEAILRVKNEQLRADLLRSISHDLRTPLTSIYGNADILLNDNNMLSDEKKKVLYGDIYDDALWLFNLVENLLSITKIEDGKMKLRIEPQMLEEVIETALKHVSRNKKYYQILINLKNEYLMADMDARLIIQVLINIIDNAIKYTPVGSLIEIIAYQKEKTVFVEIRDNGDGIPDEEKTNVFDKFYSLNKTVIDSKKSIGLGLSLCKSIIEAHGGTIFVTDNHPKGSIFTFTLPATEITIDKNIL